MALCGPCVCFGRDEPLVARLVLSVFPFDCRGFRRKDFYTVPVLKQGTPAMQVGIFEADRADVLAELERFCLPEQVRVDYSLFGQMSYVDWMRWGYLHTDHHLRQFGR